MLDVGTEAVVLLLLLTTPTPEHGWTTLNTASRRANMRQLVLAWELVGVEETWFDSKSEWNWTVEVGTVHERWRCLMDAPPGGDQFHFPDLQLVHEHLKFNADCAKLIKVMYEHDCLHRNVWKDLLWEVDEHRRFWDIVKTMHQSNIVQKRHWLRKLRDEWLGPELYYGGVLPGSVPQRYFHRGDR